MEVLQENIQVDKCIDCSRQSLAPAYVCANCGGERFVAEQVQGMGKIYSHTTIRIAPEAFAREVPYPMAIVELPSGLRLTARVRLEEGQQMAVGRRVRCVGLHPSGYWFQMVPEENGKH